MDGVFSICQVRRAMKSQFLCDLLCCRPFKKELQETSRNVK